MNSGNFKTYSVVSVVSYPIRSNCQKQSFLSIYVSTFSSTWIYCNIILIIFTIMWVKADHSPSSYLPILYCYEAGSAFSWLFTGTSKLSVFKCQFQKDSQEDPARNANSLTAHVIRVWKPGFRISNNQVRSLWGSVGENSSLILVHQGYTLIFNMPSYFPAFVSTSTLHSTILLHFLIVCFDTWSHSVTQTGLELVAILLPQIPKCWDYRCKQPNTAIFPITLLRALAHLFAVS